MHAQTIHAVILAAGRGSRFKGNDQPKALLRLGEKTLLARHIEILADLGVSQVDIVVGFKAIDVLSEALAHIGRIRIRIIPVEWRGRGSLSSLIAADLAGTVADALILMDADVLYDRKILERLIASPGRNVALVDRNFEPGDEPVKLCLREKAIVDFGKRPSDEGTWRGESVGFFRLDPLAARDLAAGALALSRSAELTTEYEDALAPIILDPHHAFSAEDVTGLPWIEIDFAEDFERAAQEILPRIDRLV